VRWLTFDCYGTLVDWRTGIARAIEAVAPGQSERLLPLYYRHEVQVQAEGFLPYREVLQEALLRAATEAGVSLSPGSERILPDTLPDWPVFPDVGPALGKLREEGWQLAILSNTDPDLFAGTRQRLPVPIDALVTAQDVGSYKPAKAHFLRFRESYQPAVQLHVAQSWFHDVVPANQLGIPAIWINRLGEDDDPSLASAVLPDLRELPAAVSRVASSQEQDRRI
jgi:2-haloacid dehalogenase